MGQPPHPRDLPSDARPGKNGAALDAPAAVSLHTGCRAIVLWACLAVPAVAADETTVAEVLGRAVSLRQLDAGQTGSLNDEARRHARAERLREVVWTAVFEDYARRRGIEVSAAEIETHVASHAAIQERLGRERAQRHAALAAELKSTGLSEARRRQAQQELDVSDRLRAFDAQRDRERRDPEGRKLQQQAERQVAAFSVRRWKIDQALHREFGGRIVFQQAGWEPIDAYRRLLERYEAEKAFTVHEPALRPAVYAYFEHRFVYGDAVMAKFYFDKPWWERTPEELKAGGF
jgi:hypothetical protein